MATVHSIETLATSADQQTATPLCLILSIEKSCIIFVPTATVCPENMHMLHHIQLVCVLNNSLHTSYCTKLLSVQCYAWTEYKFTCVCLCVCVTITLSVNSPTGQTPQRIFTVDSLKDASLRKDVPFGGSR